MTDVTLRAGRTEDVEAMYRLDCLCFEEPFRFDLPTMRRLATQHGAIVVVAEADEAVAGFAILEVTHRKQFTSGYLNTIDVDPSYRRAGLARKLMAEVDRLAGQAGVDQIRLHVSAGNEAAIRLYENLGFQRMTVSHDFYGASLDGFLYVRVCRNRFGAIVLSALRAYDRAETGT